MDFKKLIIIGTTCTGKSTLGKKLEEITKVKWYDLDDFYWLPNWVEKDAAEMIADVKTTILTKDRWIISGNYNSKMKDVIWPEADTIIWLDYTITTIIFRWIKRTIRRVFTREKVCNGNIETFYMAFLNWDNNLLRWIFKTYWKRKEKYSNWNKNQFSRLNWIVLKSQKEYNLWLTKITK